MQVSLHEFFLHSNCVLANFFNPPMHLKFNIASPCQTWLLKNINVYTEFSGTSLKNRKEKYSKENPPVVEKFALDIHP